MLGCINDSYIMYYADLCKPSLRVLSYLVMKVRCVGVKRIADADEFFGIYKNTQI